MAAWIKSIKDKKVFFIHIPKCGGTSIFETLKVKKKIELVGGAHSYASRHFKDKVDLFVTQVRNPYDRIVSHFKMIKQYNNEHDLDINDFINCIDNLQYTDKKRSIFMPNHFKPMSTWINGVKNVKVFKLENGDIWDYLDIEPSHLRKSPIGNIELTVSQKNIIYNYFREDFDNFDYER